MNIIFIILMVFIFYLFYRQEQRHNRELLKKQIAESLLIGMMNANRHFILELGFLTNRKNKSKEDSLELEHIENEFSDTVLMEVYYYSFLIESFESYLHNEEWGQYLNKLNNLDLFIDKTNLWHKGFYWADEPLRDLFLTVSIISLYKSAVTKDKAISMLDSIPIAVKNKILSIVSHPKFSELIHN